MCQYCNDLDDYEVRHLHKCDYDCTAFCETCEDQFCVNEIKTDELICPDCATGKVN